MRAVWEGFPDYLTACYVFCPECWERARLDLEPLHLLKC
jgi:hypothetical protein